MTGEGDDGQAADGIDWEISWDAPEGTFEAVEWGTAPTLDSVDAIGEPGGSIEAIARLAEPGGALLAPGRRLGEHIQIVSMLDAGGMGEVYLARDLALGRKVAVKVLRHAQTHDPEAHEHRLRLFRRDAAATAQLQHPHIVTIFQIGVERAQPFMVLEFLRGESLGSRLKRGPLPIPEALVVMEQVALALEHAHEAGVTHRDLKPANIYLRHDGTVKVLDFGVALLKTDRDEITEAFQKSPEELDAYLGDSPASAGTPLYMAPEQLRGEAQDARVDLWACGVVLYELLTGSRPFATPLLSIMRPPPSIKDALPEAPEELDMLLARCLMREPDARLPSARALVEALRQLLDGPRGLRHALGRAVASETNIGLARDAFVGRQRELRRLEALWTGGERLITLGGPGGTGKTRLARQFGAALVARFDGGVWFCDLHEARSRDAVLVRVAAALGVPLGQGDMLATVSAALAGRGATLLILDNLEQLGPIAADLLRGWLAAAPQATFIATSRARLGVREEVWLRMGPLDLPARGEGSAAEIVSSEAVALFAERARAARPGFALDDQTLHDVAELVRLLDGLPLAIELAAARVRMLSPAQLLGRLSRRFDLLQDRRAGGRQATLRATIDWSWELLGPPERAALAALSVFEEGFDADAVEQVVRLDARFDDAPWALELLEALLDQSLVRELPEQPDAAPRFDLLVSVREYAAERLADAAGIPTDQGGPFGGPDEVAATERAHAEWCAALADWQVLEALFLRGQMTIQRLRRERANLRAAWRRACARQWWPLAAQVACAMAELIEQDGPFAAGLEIVDAVVADGLDPAWQARLLCSRGRLLWRLGELDEAAQCFERGAQIGAGVADAYTQAHLTLGLGRVDAERGRPDASADAYTRTIALCEARGLERLRGVALGNLAIHTQHLGELDEALSLFGEALQIQRGLGELRQEGVVLANLGVLLFQRGDLDGSGRAIRRALTLTRELDDRRTTAALLGNLSVLERHLGHDDEALALLEQALQLARELGDRRSEGIGLGNVAHMHRRLGRLDEARRGLARALEIARQMGDSRWQGYWLSLLAEVEEEQGRFDEALDRLAEARALQEAVGERLHLGLTWCRIGQVELARGARDAAESAATLAEGLAHHLKAGPDSELGQAVEALRARLRGRDIGERHERLEDGAF